MNPHYISNLTVDNVPWHDLQYGLVELRTLRSFRRYPIERDYTDPFVRSVFREVLPQRLYTEATDWWRPRYDEETFMSNLMKFQSRRMPEPDDWESFQSKLDPVLDYKFQSYGWEDFRRLDTNWQAAAGYGYGSAKKGDPGIREKASRTATVLALEYRKGKRLTLDEYTPDLALVKPEPSPSSKSKLRPVWGVAYHNWILSALGGQPAMKAVPSLLDGYPLVHNINPSKDIPALYSQLADKYPDYHWYQVDWSSLDADVQLFESNTYDAAMNSRISFYGDELAACCWNFSSEWRSHGTVVSPNGTKYVRNGNVGSGDSLTYHKDTEVAYRRLSYLLDDFNHDHCGGKLVIRTGGDDGIIGCPSNVQLPLYQLKDRARTIFNAKLNTEKFDYAVTPRDLSLFKIEVNPGYHAQRKLDPIEPLGRALNPLGVIPNGSVSTTRVRMINDATGWANPYLTQVYFKLKRKYGEAEMSELPVSWRTSLERAGVLVGPRETGLTRFLTQD